MKVTLASTQADDNTSLLQLIHYLLYENVTQCIGARGSFSLYDMTKPISPMCTISWYLKDEVVSIVSFHNRSRYNRSTPTTCYIAHWN